MAAHAVARPGDWDRPTLGSGTLHESDELALGSYGIVGNRPDLRGRLLEAARVVHGSSRR